MRTTSCVDAIGNGSALRPCRVGWRIACLLPLAVLLYEPHSTAADIARPAPAPAALLRVYPPKVILSGPDAVQQLAVERLTTSAGPQDVTGQTRFDSADPNVVTVDQTGLVAATGDGLTVVTARAHGLSATVPVKVEAFRTGLAISFNNQIVPIFTNLGCNSGGCHGKASGQNGFRLSLLGFEPAVDYETIVHEGRGRRVFPSAADSSLLLKKATAQVPHGGGRKLDVASHEYRLIRRWIETGMPGSKPTDPQVESISIFPEARALKGGTTQQLIVTAHYSDGHSEDVSRWTQYQSNDADVAAVSSIGRVEAHRHTGQAAIMARYQGQVAVFRAIVPSETAQSQNWNFPTDNPVDAALSAHWKSLGIVPSELCTDAEFHRRASLDITGSLPSPADLQAFIADPAADKRKQLVSRLLEKPEYATFFALNGPTSLRNKRDGKPTIQHATYGFYDWIREYARAQRPLRPVRCARFWPLVAARPRVRPCSGTASSRTRRPLSMTPLRFSSACVCSALAAIITLSSAGARATILLRRLLWPCRTQARCVRQALGTRR